MNNPCKPVSLFTFVFMFIVCLMPACTDEAAELQKDVVKTTGFVVDGFGKERGYNGSYDIRVEFKDEKGKWLSVVKDISSNEWYHLSKGQKVMLVYSRKNPKIVKLLFTREDVEEATGVKDREMQIADLNALLTMKKVQVDSFLNTITSSWVKSNDSAWINESNYQYIRLFPSQRSVVYVSGPEEYRRFQKLVKQADFHETPVETSGGELSKKSFENDSLFIGLILSEEKKMILSSVTLRKKEITPAKKH